MHVYKFFKHQVVNISGVPVELQEDIIVHTATDLSSWDGIDDKGIQELLNGDWELLSNIKERRKI